MIKKHIIIEGDLFLNDTWNEKYWEIDGTNLEEILRELNGNAVKITIETQEG